MYVRLAFAIQTCLQPDLLVVDEVLSVGDIFFQQKCFDRLEALLSQGTAVALVSHDMGVIQKFSSQTMLLHNGACIFYGHPNEAVQRYYLLERAPGEGTADLAGNMPGAPAGRTENAPMPEWPAPESFLPLDQASLLGNGEARCTGVALCREGGQPAFLFEVGQTAHFFSEFEVSKDIEVPISGVTLTNSLNVVVHGKNSAQVELEVPHKVPAGSRVRCHQQIELHLAPGQYTFSVGFSTVTGEAYELATQRPYAFFHHLEEILALVERAGVLQIVPRRSGLDIPFHGLTDLPGAFAMQVLLA
jgi:hypothetical protein